ncbi:hypothetical protein PHYPSEUDO_014525 [Phytophthora pseudosyringae]|uniref:Uncharacterized protein n=1 Tax=Phytophthora pseudosyringae TaxID=221518 RepID=A0A8T1W4Z3_9STRA|nr:hypothetical protein PHYPSEUDO_014525 [Phytophthora pseudosyringae]
MNFADHSCERGDGTEAPDLTTAEQTVTTAVTPYMARPQGGFNPHPSILCFVSDRTKSTPFCSDASRRELDAAFAAPDPGLQFFVATIERMARRHVADLAAETTTLPNAVEVHSEVEAPSDSGTESDSGESVITTEPSQGHDGSSDEDESGEER